MQQQRFELGQVVATPHALHALDEAGQQPEEFLKRHVVGDWGEVDDEDRAENEFALSRQLRIMSVYTLKSAVKLWIITEADRSATTLLLPEDY